MVSLFGLEFNATGKFWALLIDLLAVYLFIWMVIVLPITLILMGVMTFGGKPTNPMDGFLLFSYFPYWFRFLLFSFIVSGTIAIPFTVLAGVVFGEH